MHGEHEVKVVPALVKDHSLSTGHDHDARRHRLIIRTLCASPAANLTEVQRRTMAGGWGGTVKELLCVRPHVPAPPHTVAHGRQHKPAVRVSGAGKPGKADLERVGDVAKDTGGAPWVEEAVGEDDVAGVLDVDAPIEGVLPRGPGVGGRGRR